MYLYAPASRNDGSTDCNCSSSRLMLVPGQSTFKSHERAVMGICGRRQWRFDIMTERTSESSLNNICTSSLNPDNVSRITPCPICILRAMFRRKKSSSRQAAAPGVTAALLQQSKAEAAQPSKAAAVLASKDGSRPQAPRVFHGPRPQQPPQNRAQVQFDVTVAQSSPMPSFAAAGATVQVNTGAASALSSPIEPTSPHQQLPLRQGGSHGEATAATARRPYFPGGFTGRRTVISNGGSLVSSCGAQSVGTDGQTLVGEHGFLARPLSHSSESATSTFISANKNVFTVGHTLEQYVNQGPEDDDWLHDVQLRKSRRHGWQYDVDRRTWRTWWCCSCRGCGE